MSAAVATLGPDDPAARARAAADAALAALVDDRERLFVAAFLACGNAREAVLEAGYTEADPGRTARRLRGRARVRDAIRACIAAREAAATVSHERACELLEQALLVRVSDLLTYTEDGVPCGLRDRSTLSASEELRLVRFQCKTHASAKGQRGGVRWIDVQLVPALEVLDRLARLRGWQSDSPQFQVLLQQVSAPAPAVATHGASLALVHDLAAELLQGDRLDRYLISHANGDTQVMATLLREGAAELRAAAHARPVEIRAAAFPPGQAPRTIAAEAGRV